jgi:deoxyribodipyrimidine photo-lyase
MSKQIVELNTKSAIDGDCVVYVMSRDQRVNDNHALLDAQESAIEKELPLVVVFNLLKTGVRAREHYEFMVTGLKEVESKLSELNIAFVLTIGDPVKNILTTCQKLNSSELYFDFNPLRGPRKVQKKIANKVDFRVSVVDTHNIIPLWVLSDKEEFAAHTIRSKVHKNLEQWLVEPAEVEKHPFGKASDSSDSDWNEAEKLMSKVKPNKSKIGFTSGENAAKKQLQSFIDRIEDYAELRNNPTQDAQSHLSSYLHFGQISSLRIALELVKISVDVPLLFKIGKLAKYDGEPTKQDSIDAFLEELIVRKELADNYCFYNEDYDNLEGAKDWAKETLHSHESDPREFIYDLKQLEQASTHDEAWNAAQLQLKKTGKMHGYMRMYWAKKILEWSPDPETAIKYTIYLNDHYSLDGGDPNGYTGIMWSIAGIHDRPWLEREIFGKIRYMNRGGLDRKFDVKGYIRKWTK